MTFLKRILLFAEIFGVKNVHLNQEIPQDISFSTGKFDNIKKNLPLILIYNIIYQGSFEILWM